MDLNSHITDVMNLLRYEELREVVLVGHSYAGTVITGVAGQTSERNARLAYLDTWPLPDDFAQIEFNSPKGRQAQQVATQREGWRQPLPSWGRRATKRGGVIRIGSWRWEHDDLVRGTLGDYINE